MDSQFIPLDNGEFFVKLPPLLPRPSHPLSISIRDKSCHFLQMSSHKFLFGSKPISTKSRIVITHH